MNDLWPFVKRGRKDLSHVKPLGRLHEDAGTDTTLAGVSFYCSIIPPSSSLFLTTSLIPIPVLGWPVFGESFGCKLLTRNRLSSPSSSPCFVRPFIVCLVSSFLFSFFSSRARTSCRALCRLLGCWSHTSIDYLNH